MPFRRIHSLYLSLFLLLITFTTSHAAYAQTTCSSTSVNMQLLVISADGTEADLSAITQALDYLGTPYTIYVGSKTPGGLTPTLLATGCNGNYQGVILTTGNLAYTPDGGVTWLSALSTPEWQNLWMYESTFKVRQATWFTYPTADFGFSGSITPVSTDTTPLAAQYTAAAASVFPYVNRSTPLNISLSYTYLAAPANDGNTTPLLTDADGDALALVHNYSDGRQNLALTFDSNPNLLHNMVLSYGVVNWVAKGVFLGERHAYLDVQPDDVFIDDNIWTVDTPCGTPVDNTTATYRITGYDLSMVARWQQKVRSQPTSAQFRLEMPFNGVGTTKIYQPDTLTPMAKMLQGQFKWISHTYDHENLDNATYDFTMSELVDNNRVAKKMGFKIYSKANLITPDVSGLTNPDALQAMYDAGVRQIVTDTSKPGYNNPSPNAGIWNTYVPGIFMIPRHPLNLYYNVTTPAEWVAEYNCMYQSYWGRAFNYNDILENQGNQMLTYLLKGDMDPLMLHQPNMRAYDGVHSLLGDLIDRAFAKYNSYFNLPVLSPTHNQIAALMQLRMAYNASGVQGTISGSTITLTVQQAAVIPVTGLKSAGSESYGGQNISHISLSAGQSVTLPLQ